MTKNKYTEADSSAIITNIITDDNIERFLLWQAKIAPIQSQFEGFIGYKLEPPRMGIRDYWVTTVAFDNDTHLNAWLNSQERAALLTELESFSGENKLTKVHNGFNFWFTKTPKKSAWKESALVLLTLYPVVFLLSFIQNPVMAYGVPFWLALFFANAASTAILAWVTMPWLVKMFGWWLNPPKKRATLYTFIGTILVLVLYIFSILGARFLSS